MHPLSPTAASTQKDQKKKGSISWNCNEKKGIYDGKALPLLVVIVPYGQNGDGDKWDTPSIFGPVWFQMKSDL